MQRSDFYFDLPPQLIAQQPTEKRSDSRLLCLDRATGEISDKYFHQLPDLLLPGDLLVMNNTRVIPARLFAQKASGGQVEILVERVLDATRCIAHVRASKSPKPGSELRTEGGAGLRVVQRHAGLFELEALGGKAIGSLLNDEGHMPLPPYIARADTTQDAERYQTVYAAQPGAVAAPTAGLHFDTVLLKSLQDKGIDRCYVTLHVGAGTFQPVRVDDIQSHKMHSERLLVTESVCKKVRDTKARGGRVIAVGTTSVRCLEAASLSGAIKPMDGETDIFLYPGKPFRTVDAMITNFHLPESTLLMLVCAFVGRDRIFAAYQHAIAQGYRFYSYGDAMFIATNASDSGQ